MKNSLCYALLLIFTLFSINGYCKHGHINLVNQTKSNVCVTAASDNGGNWFLIILKPNKALSVPWFLPKGWGPGHAGRINFMTLSNENNCGLPTRPIKNSSTYRFSITNRGVFATGKLDNSDSHVYGCTQHLQVEVCTIHVTENWT